MSSLKSELFGKITTSITWLWVGAFAGMTVSSAIPPIVQGDATLLDTRSPLSFICYWVVPFLLLFVWGYLYTGFMSLGQTYFAHLRFGVNAPEMRPAASGAPGF